MKIKSLFWIVGILLCLISLSFNKLDATTQISEFAPSDYQQHFDNQLISLKNELKGIVDELEGKSKLSESEIATVRLKLHKARNEMKNADYLLRYLEPIAYKKINGPLPVEWETEVFEKFEKPYKREGAGLTLAEIELDENTDNQGKSISELINQALKNIEVYQSDSIRQLTNDYHHFYLSNRLHLLNLAAIYTTGFECPDTTRVIPELLEMMRGMQQNYASYNASFPNQTLSADYVKKYQEATEFVANQPTNYSSFDHFAFIQQYVNPLFGMNTQHILGYKVVSRSNNDYSLNKSATSIFSKNLYNGQNTKGLFLRVSDSESLAQLEELGRNLFFDVRLSGDNSRSCATCHNPEEGFTQNNIQSALNMNQKDHLLRNTPSLLNAQYNHLIMQDGAHISLQDQTIAVLTNPDEMNASLTAILKYVKTDDKYKKGFKNLLQFTPQEKEVTIQHVVSAITFFYGKFGKYAAPFDDAMNQKGEITADARAGFNLFMSRSQCATCHFVPQFNGVKPPYVGSEFEVLGTPNDRMYTKLDADVGRHGINPAFETKYAFRTGTLRNAEKTAPYMHNGVFINLDEVLEFYNGGGGVGRGFELENQTLSSDSLRLTVADKSQLTSFIQSLTEQYPITKTPLNLSKK